MTGLKQRLLIVVMTCLAAAGLPARSSAENPPRVVVLTLDGMVNHVTTDYVIRGLQHANESHADAVLLELDTPGGLSSSMADMIKAIFDSRAPVITYVAPSGSSAASAGFFILLAGDVAVMAPGTHSGAAHPVVLFNTDVGKTMEAKIENDAASYIRSIAEKRGRNVPLAEAAVRESKSYTEKEALDGKLIDLVAPTRQELLTQLDGKTIRRINDSTVALKTAGATLEPITMTRRERALAWVSDPNIAFLLGAAGVGCLYIEFTHPGLVAPGVVGAVALVLALYAFNMLPLNILGVLMIVLAIVLFVMEAFITSHGVLGAGGAVAMVIGALILVDSPWPEARVRLSTALGVTLPLAVITVILAKFAFAAQRSKAVMGATGMMGLIGVAQTDLSPEGKVMVRGEIWNARTESPVSQGDRVRVKSVEGLTLFVEKAEKRG